LRTLPQGITFGTNCTGFAANRSAMRFNRLGGWCDPAAATWTCPAVDVGTNLLQNSNAAGTTICLSDARSGLTRQLFIDPGGRVRLDS